MTGLLSGENVSGAVERSYTYAPGGIVAGHTDAISGVTETFTFDYLQRVERWDQNGAGANLSTAFNYDVVTGNLMTQSRSAGGTVENTTALTYQPNSHRPVRRTEEVFGSVNVDIAMLYDQRGRRTQGPWSEVTYTSANLPRTIEDKHGITEFRYDAFGARVLKRGATKTITTHGGAYRRVGDLHVMSVSGLAEIRVDTAAGTRETFYQHANYRGDTVAVTDESGDVVERRAYSPFGRRLDDDHLRPVDTPLPMSGSFFGFTGHEHDDELGLINMRGRVFDPASSTFLTQDPLVTRPLHGPAWNGYSYVSHAPTQFTDPTGFQELPEAPPNPLYGREAMADVMARQMVGRVYANGVGDCIGASCDSEGEAGHAEVSAARAGETPTVTTQHADALISEASETGGLVVFPGDPTRDHSALGIVKGNDGIPVQTINDFIAGMAAGAGRHQQLSRRAITTQTLLGGMIRTDEIDGLVVDFSNNLAARPPGLLADESAAFHRGYNAAASEPPARGAVPEIGPLRLLGPGSCGSAPKTACVERCRGELQERCDDGS